MFKLISVLLLSVTGYFIPTFSDSSYTQYSWKEFYQLPEVNDLIDFDHPNLNLLSACVFYASNEQREQKDKKQFFFSADLRNTAQFHTQEMTDRNFFSHYNPYKSQYKTLEKRIKEFNCRFNVYGENIALFSTEEITYLEAGKQLVKDWMNSKGHRTNLMNQQFTHLGCGVKIMPYKGEEGTYLIYSTQDFGGLGY